MSHAPSEPARRRRPARALAVMAVAYGVGLIALSVVHLVAPQRNGLLALTQVFAPHLFLPLVVAVPVGWALGGRQERLVVAVALAVGAVRFAPGMLPLALPAGDEGVRLPVFSWNLAAGEVSARALVEELLTSDAELVGLQELRPSHARAIEGEAALLERFPYRVLVPHDSVLGIGLLSRYPIAGSAWSYDPPHVVARLEVSDAPLTVVSAHPLPPRMGLVEWLPRRYETGARDADLRMLRGLVQPALDAGEMVVMLGDFNVTDREPAYAELTAGLADAYRQVGWGPGSTWRPPPLAWLPFALLRIDYLLSGGPVRPLEYSVECRPDTGDHCIVHGAVLLEGVRR